MTPKRWRERFSWTSPDGLEIRPPGGTWMPLRDWVAKKQAEKEQKMPNHDEARTLTDADVKALAEEIERRSRRRGDVPDTQRPAEPLRASNHFVHEGEEPLVK